VLVDRPDRKGRIDILKVHVRKVKLDPALQIDNVAALTPGFSGADLANLVNEATLVATRRKANLVTMPDFTAAVERIVAGLERHSRVLSPKEREAVAFHEMGHALVALAQKGSDPVHKVSIIPRGIGALGYTIQRPTEDRYLMTRAELEQKIAILLGGRAAEKLIFGQLSTGAADDLAKATDIARDMVTRYGMDEDLGYVAFETPRQTLLDLPEAIAPHHTSMSQETQRRVDEAIRGLVMGGFEHATALLAAHRPVLEQGARALLDKETLDEAAIRALAAQLKPGP
jgi:cell division protease FtsH